MEIHDTLVRYALVLATDTFDGDRPSRAFMDYYNKAESRMEGIRQTNWKLKEGEIAPPELLLKDFIVNGVKVQKLIDLIHQAKRSVPSYLQPYRFTQHGDEYPGNLFMVIIPVTTDPFSRIRKWKLSDFDNLTTSAIRGIEIYGEEGKINEINYNYKSVVREDLKEATERALNELKKWASLHGDKHFEVRFYYFLGLVQICVAAKINDPTLCKILLAEGSKNLHYFVNESEKGKNKRGVEG
ncbi:MAG: hypothetical protein AOA66_0895 [Candidatus Bathyarchaeota archaeon BA2]|nr:MAG: hypothetical protein AOA66_0895 [Candidatus Bathyarchaeota archaeon BA2]